MGNGVTSITCNAMTAPTIQSKQCGKYNSDVDKAWTEYENGGSLTPPPHF